MPEQVVASLHPTRLLFLGYYLIAFFLIILGIVMGFGLIPVTDMIENYYFFGISVIGLIPLVVAEVRIRHDTYILTTNKITERVGSFSVVENTVTWDRLSNYTLKQSFLDRMFGVGTIELWSIGEEEEPEVSIKKVSHVKKIIAMLDKLIQTTKGPVV